MDFITNNTFEVYTVDNEGGAKDLINRFSILINDMNEIYVTCVDPKHLLAAFCFYDVEFRKLWNAMNHQRLGGYNLVENKAVDGTSQLTLRTIQRALYFTVCEVYRRVRTSSISIDEKKNVYMPIPVYFPDFVYMMTEVSQDWDRAMEICKDDDTSVLDVRNDINNILHVGSNTFVVVEAMEPEFIVDLDKNEWYWDGEDVPISYPVQLKES